MKGPDQAAAARIAELEAALARRDKRIEELKDEVKKGADLIDQFREQAEDTATLIDDWIVACDMEQDSDGVWLWGPNVSRLANLYSTLRDDHEKLVRKWNRFVGEYNGTIRPRDRGRPLAASEHQASKVRKLRKAGTSLRKIVAQTGLGLRTVRTILEKDAGTDRTTKRTNELRRREIDRLRAAEWRARKRSMDALPKRINATRQRGAELVKAAKGLDQA